MAQFRPTDEQHTIVAAARTTSDNLLIEALAGAAKSYTLKLIVKALPSVPTLMLAFNKKIADELQERMPSHCKCMTLNSLGHRAWGEVTGGRLFLARDKCADILRGFINDLPKSEQEELWDSFGDMLRAISHAKGAGHVPDSIAETVKCSPLMDDQHLIDSLDEILPPFQRQLLIRTLETSMQQAFEGKVDFNDQLLMPTVFRASFPSYPLVMVDEAQDLSELNHVMISKLVRKRIIAVGDQCQPAGTMVSVVRKKADRWNAAILDQVPIEKLNVGDNLLGYNGEGSFMSNRKLKGMSVNYYDGLLITASLPDGTASTYTENHHCYANFNSLRSKFALYLMRKGDKYRVGRCKMEYENGSGPTRRALSEGADAYWLVKTFDTEREAALEEAVLQAQFGIPDITFKCPNTNVGFANQSYLDEAWAYILSSVDLTSRATACLDYYKRAIEHPIWTKGGQAKISLLRPSMVHATNLIDGCLMLPYTGESKIAKAEWQPITLATKWVEGEPVYSLTVSDNQLYVADNLVTHNCQAIYAFRGAHESGMDRLAERFSMTKLSLSTTFRCPEAIVEHVRWRAPSMLAWDKHPLPGQVNYPSRWTLDDIPDDAAIICRNNAPLFGIAIALLKEGRYPNLIGNDIGIALMKVMDKFGPPTLPQASALEALSLWATGQGAKVKNKKALEDKRACIEVFLLAAPTLGGAINYAKTLFSSRGRINLMTGHKSKGGEWDHVFFLNENLLGEDGQEPNLRYVIATRAKQSLTYIKSGERV